MDMEAACSNGGFNYKMQQIGFALLCQSSNQILNQSLGILLVIGFPAAVVILIFVLSAILCSQCAKRRNMSKKQYGRYYVESRRRRSYSR
ncbi:hypothetical protein GJ496_010676 [Pomphorhynchus laevis]|nr:hypothetical protein GJ496_010676 [Pomphorhynchus laevis]